MIYILFDFYLSLIKGNFDRNLKYIISIIFILFFEISYIDNIENFVVYIEKLIRIKYF